MVLRTCAGPSIERWTQVSNTSGITVAQKYHDLSMVTDSCVKIVGRYLVRCFQVKNVRITGKSNIPHLHIDVNKYCLFGNLYHYRNIRSLTNELIMQHKKIILLTFLGRLIRNRSKIHDQSYSLGGLEGNLAGSVQP